MKMLKVMAEISEYILAITIPLMGMVVVYALMLPTLHYLCVGGKTLEYYLLNTFGGGFLIGTIEVVLSYVCYKGIKVYFEE